MASVPGRHQLIHPHALGPARWGLTAMLLLAKGPVLNRDGLRAPSKVLNAGCGATAGMTAAGREVWEPFGLCPGARRGFPGSNPPPGKRPEG